MKLCNLTPHTLVLRAPDGTSHELISVGLARVVSKPGSIVTAPDCPVPIYSAPEWGEVQGLPSQEPGVLFIVSALVASHVQRADVVSPGTGPLDGAVRNEQGQVVAVTRLIRSC